MLIKDSEINYGFTVAKNLVAQTINPERPNFWTETLPAYYSENNLLVNTWRGIKGGEQILSSHLTPPAEGFKPLTEESTAGIPTKYWEYLSEAYNEKDLEIRRNKIFRELKDLNIRQKSSGWAYFGAGLLEMITDPITYLPIPKVRRYANLIEGFGKNILNVAPSVFVPAAISNAAVIATKETKDIEDWALETFMQGVVGSALIGIPGAFGAWEFTRAKAGMKAQHADLDLKAIIAEKNTKQHKKGEVIGYKAVPSADSEVTVEDFLKAELKSDTKTETKAALEKETLTPSEASRLERAINEAKQKENMTVAEQTLLNAKQIQNLLDEGVAYLGEKRMFKLWYKPSPIIKGLTSPFEIFRKFTNGMFDHNFLLGKMEHPKLREINNKIDAIKKLIREAGNQEKHWTTEELKIKLAPNEEQIKLKEELARLKEEKKILQSKQEELKATFQSPTQQFAAEIAAAKHYHMNHYCEMQAKEIWKESRGLGGILSSKTPLAETTADVLAKLNQDGAFSFRETMEMATYALRRGEKSANPVAEKIAKLYREQLYDPILNELKEMKLLPENLTVNEALGYVNRLYDKKLIVAKKDRFIAILEKFYQARDNKIKEILTPIRDIEEQIKKLNNSLKQHQVYKEKLTKKNANVAEVDQLIKQTELDIESNLRKLQKEKDILQYQIDTGTIPLSELDKQNGITQLSLVDGKPTFTKSLKEEHAALTSKLNSLKEQLEVAKKTNTNKKELGKIRKAIKNEITLIREKIENGEVSKELFYKGKNSGKLYLTNIQKKTLASIALPIKDYAHLATSIAGTILGDNSQQMAARIFNGIRGAGSGKGRPSALKSRTVLCADHILKEFLINDLSDVAAAHAGNLSTFIALEKFYKQFGTNSEEAKDFFIKELTSEYKKMEDTILRTKDTPGRAKRLAALKKDFDTAQNGISEFLDVFRGDYERPKSQTGENIQAIINNLKSYAYSTMMGGVALMFQTDIVMPMFKHGFRHIVDGIMPVLGQMVDMKIPRHVWADSAVGIQTALATLRKEVWGKGSQFWSLEYRSGINRLMGNMSKLGSNLFFINQLSDVAEEMAANTAASALMRDIEKWMSKGHFVEATAKDGRKIQKWISEYKFTQKELERLELGRFDMQEYGQATYDMFKKHGQTAYGGYIPNTTAWGNTKAAENFRMYIRREVDHLVNRPKKADSPFWFRHPALSLTTQFLTWSMGITNNIAIPMLQRMDQEKLTWAICAISLGSLTGPMRQLANGEEVNWDKRTLLTEGIMQSGILGWQIDQLLRLNSVLDPAVLRPFQSDRFRRKSLIDLYAGPVGSILSTAGNTASMFLNGELNKKDFRRAIKLAPYTNCFYFRQLLNDWVESTSMPKRPPKRYYGEEAEHWW